VTVSEHGTATLADHWAELVTVAMLGTDRRDPPDPPGSIADLVDDTVRTTPSGRMLAQVAAVVAARRAGVLPAPPVPRLDGPPGDPRPIVPEAAIDRWHHVATSWPVLEDEWMLTVVAGGWRLAPELAPAVLRRHRRDPVRRARAVAAIGPSAAWLVDLSPELAPSGPPATVAAEALGELPELPIPPDLQPMLVAPGTESGRRLAHGLETGALGAPHRAVLVNLVARVRPEALGDLAGVLDAVDRRTGGFGVASALADLATTRGRMLDELKPPGSLSED
jgi:hypothetical protein